MKTVWLFAFAAAVGVAYLLMNVWFYVHTHDFRFLAVTLVVGVLLLFDVMMIVISLDRSVPR